MQNSEILFCLLILWQSSFPNIANGKLLTERPSGENNFRRIPSSYFKHIFNSYPGKKGIKLKQNLLVYAKEFTILEELRSEITMSSGNSEPNSRKPVRSITSLFHSWGFLSHSLTSPFTRFFVSSCLSHGLVSLKRHHDRGNSYKKAFSRDLLSVSEV